MDIRQKRIKTADSYLGDVPPGGQFRIVVTKADLDSKKLERAGFGNSPTAGHTILPNMIGPISRFNAEGKYIRDPAAREKEPRYLYTREWTHTEWHRDERVEVTNFYDYYRDCWPRILIAPPAVELIYHKEGSWEGVVSPVLSKDSSGNESAKHIINLFLELFGACGVVSKELTSYAPPKVFKHNWKLLPPGEYPWARLSTHLSDSLKGVSDSIIKVIMDRAETIRGHKPDEVHRGMGGFNDYVAYIFKEKGLVVLECIRKGNAIYVLGNNWEKVSQLSKGEIIKGSLHKERIVHTQGWKERLKKVLS